MSARYLRFAGVSPPALKLIDPKQVYCVQNPSLALAVNDAPLVFATELAHGLTLHVQNKSGQKLDLPVKPDPSRGGFVVDGSLSKLKEIAPKASGTLYGSWGFESFEGPTFHLRNSPTAEHWAVSTQDENALVVGREDTFHLHSTLAACVEEITACATLKDGRVLKLKTMVAARRPKLTLISINVPRPIGTDLYIRLRDDADTINTAILPVLPEQTSNPTL